MTEQEIEAKAERMTKTARLAALNAQEVISKTVEEEYGNEDAITQIGAQATAVVSHFISVLEAAERAGHKGLARMIVGIIQDQVPDRLEALAKLAGRA